MRTREEVEDLFAEFLKQNNPHISELLILAEFCIVEAAAREAIHPSSAKRIIDTLLEEQGVERASSSK